MDPYEFPTKGNLMRAKNSLGLVRQGQELMEKKRNILVRELMVLIDEAKDIQSEIDETFTRAYQALQRATIEMGIRNVEELAHAAPVEHSIRIKSRSIMGTEIPLVEHSAETGKMIYTFLSTRESMDRAKRNFERVKELTIRLSMVENSAYRLAVNIRKTQKRANAMKNIMIPLYAERVRSITNALEEKDREEFGRLKLVKKVLESAKTCKYTLESLNKRDIL